MQDTQTKDIQKVLLRQLVGNVYDAQTTRIAMGNRLIACFRELGIIVGKDPESLDLQSQKIGAKHAAASKKNEVDEAEVKEKEEKENNKLLVRILDEYALVSKTYAEKFDSRGSIVKALKVMDDLTFLKTEFAYNMVSMFGQMMKTEQMMLDLCAKEVKKHPLWDKFFKDVKGCGPLMAAVCIAYLDPYKARYASSFWKYAGLDVVLDEKGAHGRSRRDAGMVSYIDKDGKEAQKRGLGYNPFVKTKLIGVLGSSFLRAGSEATYAKVYYDYKNRLQNRPDCAELRPAVIHRRAIRYAVKMFLRDLWKVWRELEGLPVGDDYAVAKLDMEPHHASRNEVTDDDVRAATLRAMGLGAD